MLTNTEAKNIWREQWLGSINELTSLDLQKKSWLDNSHTNPHWSFIEFNCCYFDDLFIKDNYQFQLEKGWLTKQEFEIVKDWHKALDEYNAPKNDDYDHEAILNDSKWLEIIQTGVIVKNKLMEILAEKEKQLLTEEKDYLKYI